MINNVNEYWRSFYSLWVWTKVLGGFGILWWGIDTKNYTPQFLEAPTRQKRPSLESYIMRTFAGKVEKGGLESGIVFNGVWEVVIIGALWDNVGLRCRKRE